MSTEISLADKVHYAEVLSSASLLPEKFRGKPSDVLLAIEWGEGLGMTPMQAINSIHVIDGKPGLSAAALAALVRRAGHRMRVTGDETRAEATIVRRDDPEFTYRAVWTIDMARHAGLVIDKKPNWTKYPGAMLRARAQTSVVKDACPELIIGIGDEALEADPADWPTTVTVTQDDVPDTPDTVEVDTETGEIIDRAPDELIAKVKAAATAAGYTSHPQVKSLLETVLGRAAGPNLTTPEAEAVLAHLAGAS